jgi:hypothetical protein
LYLTALIAQLIGVSCGLLCTGFWTRVWVTALASGIYKLSAGRALPFFRPR